MLEPTVLATTRRSLHALAEWVLAPARQAHDGRIGLRPTAGGFGAPEIDCRVQGLTLVARGEAVALTDLAAAAEHVGVAAGRATGVYETVTPWTGDEPLPLDAGAAELIAGWFALGAQALDEIRGTHPDASDLTLWPEHFDLALTVADRVNLGASPGDDDHALPYLYVGPWEPRSGPFWNEPFGASVSFDLVEGPAGAVEFFRTGLAALDR